MDHQKRNYIDFKEISRTFPDVVPKNPIFVIINQERASLRSVKTKIMALIKMSSIGITNLSGKAGGSVYAHNRGGAYVRNFAVPSNPQTQAQAAARAVFGGLAAKWRALSQEAQEAWRAASQNFPYIDRFGDEKVMSGENLYISLNRNLDVISNTSIGMPPTPQGVDGIQAAEAFATIDTGVLGVGFEKVVTIINEGATTSFAIYASPGMSPGISYAKNRLRLVTVQDETEFENETDFGAEYTAIFGLPAVGSKVFFRIDPINEKTGERGASFFVSVLVNEVTP